MSQHSRVPSSKASCILSTALLVVFCPGLWPTMSLIAREKSVASKAVQTNWGQVGRWTNGFNTAAAVHTHLLPNGKVLSWTVWTPEPLPGIQTYVRLWNPADGTLTDVHNYSDFLFCSGHSLLPDGRLLITGGQASTSYDGINKSSIFDPTGNGWKHGQNMNNGRWYPTNVALGNGETLTASGSYCVNGVAICESILFNNVPQVFHPVNETWRTLSGAEYPLPLYPWLHLASDGRVYSSGPSQYPIFMTTTGTGSWSAGRLSLYGYRDSGSAVMYDVDKILIVGGGNPPTNTAEYINLAETLGGGLNLCGRIKDAPPCWRNASAMSVARRHLDTTLLADGKVLATGGTSGGTSWNDTCGIVLSAELWNPANDTWTTMASMTQPRIYHSSAILLPDARVLVAGSTYQNAIAPCPEVQSSNQTEIFWPPYLYNSDGTAAVRPTITQAPTVVNYGQNYNVQVGAFGADVVSKVTLVRLSSSTHSFNQNQRFNNLAFTRLSNTLTVTIPSNSNACPPGHYMLFVINGNGTPSEARIIKVTA